MSIHTCYSNDSQLTSARYCHLYASCLWLTYRVSEIQAIPGAWGSPLFVPQSWGSAPGTMHRFRSFLCKMIHQTVTMAFLAGRKCAVCVARIEVHTARPTNNTTHDTIDDAMLYICSHHPFRQFSKLIYFVDNKGQKKAKGCARATRLHEKVSYFFDGGERVRAMRLRLYGNI